MFARRTFSILRVLALTGASLLSAGNASSADAPGAVYALTNSPSGNAVVVYNRGADGSLTPAGSYASGGTGTGAGLGSQDAVIVTADHRLLFAVNPGSDSLSSFRIHPDGLELIDTAPSGGTMPTSVTFRAGLLYVLNAGVPNSVSGFKVSPAGKLTPLIGSTRPLSGASTSPAQVGFSDDGATLIVTERATNVIDTYSIDESGFLTGPFPHLSAGPTPFGFAVDKRNTVLVSEAGAGGGASSYRVDAVSGLEPVSSAIMTGQRAACWAIVTTNGRYGYVTNAGTGNISGFAIDQDGSVSLLDADGITAVTGGNPTDIALSQNSQFLYVRVAALGQIAVFRIGSDGSLRALPPLTGTPAGLAGLAGF
jgi:6-phosphogluconolactonase (cycloisomerase 2 family)